jgi:hypothetical protein
VYARRVEMGREKIYRPVWKTNTWASAPGSSQSPQETLPRHLRSGGFPCRAASERADPRRYSGAPHPDSASEQATPPYAVPLRSAPPLRRTQPASMQHHISSAVCSLFTYFQFCVLVISLLMMMSISRTRIFFLHLHSFRNA